MGISSRAKKINVNKRQCIHCRISLEEWGDSINYVNQTITTFLRCPNKICDYESKKVVSLRSPKND